MDELLEDFNTTKAKLEIEDFCTLEEDEGNEVDQYLDFMNQVKHIDDLIQKDGSGSKQVQGEVKKPVEGPSTPSPKKSLVGAKILPQSKELVSLRMEKQKDLNQGLEGSGNSVKSAKVNKRKRSEVDNSVSKKPKFNEGVPSKVPISSTVPISSQTIPTQSIVYSTTPLEVPFIFVTSSTGKRVYIEVDEDIPSEDAVPLTTKNNRRIQLNNLLEQVNQLESKYFLDKVNLSKNKQDHYSMEEQDSSNLWVDKYSPNGFIDLLSDGKTNREVLVWMKQWDPHVFKKPFVNPQDKNAKNEPPKGRPNEKVLLLHGHPGVGKTTLAHTVALNAGYLPIEMNASDDRTEKKFLPRVLDALTMQDITSLVNKNPKPKCLIIDEIDGVLGKEGKGAISGLVNLVDAKGTKKKDLLNRPIICICNDPWVPALKSLKDRSKIFQLRPPAKGDLMERLKFIIKNEKLKIDNKTLEVLIELTNSDIRACINTLQILSRHKGPISSEILTKAVFGSKDLTDNIFDIWKAIFIKDNRLTMMQSITQKHNEPQETKSGSDSGLNKLHDMISRFGTQNKIIDGCYEYYLEVAYHDPLMSKTQNTITWFEFYSMMNASGSDKWFELEKYKPLTSVSVHLNCQVAFYDQIKYPRKDKESYDKLSSNQNIIKSFVSGLTPPIRQSYSSNTELASEFLPYFVSLIHPNTIAKGLSSYNPKTFTEVQKNQLNKLSSVCIDYGIRWQSTTLSGKELMAIVPPIVVPVRFHNDNKGIGDENEKDQQMATMGVPVALAGILMHTIKTEEKNRIVQSSHTASNKKGQTAPITPIKAPPSDLPKKKSLTPEKKTPEPPNTTKDFFGRTVFMDPKKKSPPGKVHAQPKPPIIFRHQEGFTNAVKRSLYIKDFK
uniref:AAA+ ATPase domain-containing protein n=1 Tax=Arcella intermedia TaxID=1963864 RepID=A0A6B2KXR2_9EUKA